MRAPRSRKVAIGVATAAITGIAALAGVLAFRRHARAERAETLARIDVAAACPQAGNLGPTCARCVAAYCCPELRACFGSSACIDVNDCYVTAGEGEKEGAAEGAGGDLRHRTAACLAKEPGAVRSFLAWDGCARKNCEDVCPRGPEED